ncbi:MAG: hypothetical protein ACOC7T_01275 [Planctomycetota bacterium]
MSASRYTARDCHLRICPETTRGVCPDSPDWRSVPLPRDGFPPGAEAEFFAPETRFGGYRRRALLREGVAVRGSFATAARPRVTGLLLEMALARTAGRMGSYCVDRYAPADPRRLLGALAVGLRISVRADRGDVELRLELVGLAEEANGSLTPADFDYADLGPGAFAFRAAEISLDGTSLEGVEEFAIEVRNRVHEGPMRGGAPAFLEADRRTVGVELTAADPDTVVGPALRAGSALPFQAVFRHAEGHELTLELPELRPQSRRPRGPADGVAGTTARFEAGAAGGVDVEYSLNLVP